MKVRPARAALATSCLNMHALTGLGHAALVDLLWDTASTPIPLGLPMDVAVRGIISVAETQGAVRTLSVRMS